MDKKATRQFSIELLRIIAMIMIVGHHLSFFGGVEFDRMSISVNRLWTQFLVYGGHVGVDIFVLISGYFMINVKSIRLDKIARLWLMMFFYSFGMYIVAMCFFGYSFSTNLLFVSVTPFLNKQWPFASAFLVLMILSPFVNVLLQKLNKASYRLLLGIIYSLWVVIPTLTTFDGESNYLLWMLALYSLAAYVRLYPEDFKAKAGKYIGLGILVALLSFASAVVFDLMGMKYEVFARYATHFSGMQHLNIVLWAFLLFIGFSRLENGNKSFLSEKSGRIINYLASLMFGVYLLHEDFFSRKILWENIFDNRQCAESGYYVLITIGEIAAIIIVGIVVEWIRLNLLEHFYMKFIVKKLSGLQKKLDGVMKDV